jgi:hypothetical protein
MVNANIMCRHEKLMQRLENFQTDPNGKIQETIWGKSSLDQAHVRNSLPSCLVALSLSSSPALVKIHARILEVLPQTACAQVIKVVFNIIKTRVPGPAQGHFYWLREIALQPRATLLPAAFHFSSAQQAHTPAFAAKWLCPRSSPSSYVSDVPWVC